MANLKISDLTELAASAGNEYAEVIIPPFSPGTNRKILTSKLVVTREFGRTWTSDLLFDKNEIDYEEHTLTGDVTYTLVPIGHLENQFSFAIQTIVVDGIQTINFDGFQFIYGIQNGAAPDAGTYQVFFMYRNGVATANWTEPSSEAANLVTLPAPAAFTATANGEDQIDLAWTNNPNAASYQIDQSPNGADSWALLTSPAAGASSYSHTGLTSGQQVFYRIRAMGDLVAFANSSYSLANATTENAGDVTGPVASFSIAGAATDIPINQVLTITFDEAARKVGGTAITNANAGDVVMVKQTNSGGSTIPCTFIVNAGKTEIQVVPNVIFGLNQLVFVRVHTIEDSNGNASGNQDTTFTTNDFTINANNYLDLGDILDSVIGADNADFNLKLTIKSAIITTGSATLLFRKYTSLSAGSFYLTAVENDIVFRWYSLDAVREITWPNCLTTAEHDINFHYKGAIDTNNGLDRGDLFIDGVLFTTGKNLSYASAPSMTNPWPFGIRTSTSPFLIGPNFALCKDLFVTSANDTVEEVDIPIVRTGEDQSGNNRDGTYVTY